MKDIKKDGCENVGITDCECHYTIDDDGIHFCEMHAAAEEMLIALKAIRLPDVHTIAREMIVKAIAKAEGQ